MVERGNLEDKPWQIRRESLYPFREQKNHHHPNPGRRRPPHRSEEALWSRIYDCRDSSRPHHRRKTKMKKNTPEEVAAAKARDKARRATFDAKAKAALRARAYRATPEGKAAHAACVARYRVTAKGRAARARALAKPEYKARAAFRESTPECQAYRAAYRSSPEAKAARASCSAAFHAARRGTEEFKTYRRGIENARNATPLGNLMSRLRCRTAAAFRARGFKKGSKTAALLGCEWGLLKAHIEVQFKDGMSWENRHLWHIDHITPLSSAKDEEAMTKLCHYSNLQPLWWRDNLSKGAKVP